MKIKNLSKYSLIFIGAETMVFSLTIILFFNLIQPAQSSILQPIKKVVVEKKEKIETPFILKIPKIKINVVLGSVGLTSQGAVDVPRSMKDVAWFNFGPRPGEIGSSVLVGHFGLKQGVPGVFNNLAKLKKGDKIYTVNEKGITTTFVVRKVNIYKQNDKVPEIFSTNKGKTQLNLITCEGIWDKKTKSYSGRLVVFADKI